MSLHVYQHTMKASSLEQLFPCFSWAACPALMSSCILHAAFLLYSLQFFLVILIFFKAWPLASSHPCQAHSTVKL